MKCRKHATCRVLSIRFGKGHPQRTGSKACYRRDVRSGCVHPQGHRSYAAAFPRTRRVERPGQPRHPVAGRRADGLASEAYRENPLTWCWMPGTKRSDMPVPWFPAPCSLPWESHLRRRSLLGVSVSLSEAEVHWRDFIASLQDRGMHGVKLMVSDNHAGLKAAREARLPGVPWQRCQFHLQQNACHYVPRIEMRPRVASDLRAILNAPDRTEADRLLQLTVKKYEKTAPKLAAWMSENA